MLTVSTLLKIKQYVDRLKINAVLQYDGEIFLGYKLCSDSNIYSGTARNYPNDIDVNAYKAGLMLMLKNDAIAGKPLPF